MVPTFLQGLAEEKIVLLGSSESTVKLPLPLHGILRIVDRAGNTLGLVMGKETLENIEEEIEASNPEFLAFLKKSRQTGRVSGKEVKKKTGL